MAGTVTLSVLKEPTASSNNITLNSDGSVSLPGALSVSNSATVSGVLTVPTLKESTSSSNNITLNANGSTTIVSIIANSSISDSIGNVRSVPQNAQTSSYVLVAADNGKHISITTGGVTVNASVFSIGDTVTIFNNSSSSQTITQGSSVTLRQSATTNTGNRTLAGYGICTILCVASNVFVITGSGLT